MCAHCLTPCVCVCRVEYPSGTHVASVIALKDIAVRWPVGGVVDLCARRVCMCVCVCVFRRVRS